MVWCQSPSQRRSSVAIGLIAGLLLLSVISTGVGAAMVVGVYRGQAEQQRMADLGSYARERARYQQALFQDLADRHAAATVTLQMQLSSGRRRDDPASFARYFPKAPDGTRRGAQGLIDGSLNARLQGVTGFMGGAEPRPAEQGLLLAATEVVAAAGGSQRTRLDNFYFFTPQNRLVMFAPDQPAKLDFYRRQAPAGLNLADTEMLRITLPRANPERRTRCTALLPLLSDPTGRTLTTGCMTPVYIDGRYVGAWGTTLPINSYLLSAIQDAPAGRLNLITDASGALIAYPGFKRPGAVTPEQLARYQSQFDLQGLLARVRATGAHSGVTVSPNGAYLVAYGQLPGPDWYFLTLVPRAESSRMALRSAWPLILGGIIFSLVQAALILWWTRRVLARPLGQLAREATDSAQASEIEALAARPDEIGLLAQALASERRQKQELLEELEYRVAARTAELNRATQAKTDFLATMSHELRTPLNGVIALSDILSKRLDKPQDREAARIITSSGRLLEQVLNDVLDVSKIEAGQLDVVTEPFDLAAAVQAIAELHRASAEAKGLAFQWSIAPDVPHRLVGDAVRLTQVLSNLLSNAVKFTSHGGVTLAVTRDGDRLCAEVRDSGIGFAPEVAERLFSRFEQADSSISRRFGGTGLGLAICAALSRLMGGTVRATSVPDQGSVFTLDLPLVAAAEAPSSAVAEPGEALGRLRILLAEDHPTNQKVISLILADLDVDLAIAQDGAEAVARAGREIFDIILMDVHMPVMDGLAATRRIREQEAASGRRTPIIALTADALPENVMASLAAGADRHLAKPIRPDVLLSALVEALAA